MPFPALLGIPLVLAVVGSPSAHAAVTVGAYITVGVAVNLGPVPDRARVGFALEGGAQLFWPSFSDVGYHVGPLTTAAAHLAWTRPVTSAQLVVSAGPMYPLVVGSGGFIPLLGAQIGAGVGLATDGAAGPVFVAQVVAPFTELRFDTVLWRKELHAPRLSAGFSLENCCSYDY